MLNSNRVLKSRIEVENRYILSTVNRYMMHCRYRMNSKNIVYNRYMLYMVHQVYYAGIWFTADLWHILSLVPLSEKLLQKCRSHVGMLEKKIQKLAG